MRYIATSTIAALTLLAVMPAASGSDYKPRARIVSTGHDYRAPCYVRTKELCRHIECRWAKDHCGRRYAYEVTVITFADIFSDGSRRTYTRTYRA